MLVNLRSWSISCASSCTFLPASSTLVTSLGPTLCSRIVGPRETKALLEKLDTHYSSSSFLKGIMKMSDFEPFSDHDKPNEGVDK